MRKFNPEKKLNKIKNGNKNKILYSIIALLLIIGIGSTYALYQVRHSNKLTHITVKQFYQNDLDLAVYVDGVKKVTEKEFPTKENRTNLIYTGIKCEDGKEINASWDYDTWALDVKSKLPNKCNVYFETRWKDNSGAAYPELYQGLIPVRYDGGKMYIADLASEWYDYDKHNWANAVLIDYQNETIKNKFYDENGNLRSGDEIQESDILQMYVWIPRYRYKLWNAISGETSNPQEIKIEFEDNTKSRSLGQTNGEWLTHPAFLFGNTELNGIWASKFELSGTIDNIEIKPNQPSLHNYSISVFFDTIRNIDLEKSIQYNLNSSEIDTHIMKNMDWGAIVYLSHSKYGRYEADGREISLGAQVWKNNTFIVASGAGSAITGCSEPELNSVTYYNAKSCEGNNTWNNGGVKASTTGNMYGIYDLSGGCTEYLMGVSLNEDGSFNISSSGFAKPPLKKYYDAYSYGTDTLDHARGHLGDATRETLINFGKNASAWYNVSSGLAIYDAPYIARGGFSSDKTLAGIFRFANLNGNSFNGRTTRIVITAQDGVE